MGVAAHLGIKLTEYDARIRSFIPDYEEMLDAAAGAIPAGARTIVDLGIGTGALAWRCAQKARKAKIVGIDADGEILKMAQQRLNSRASVLCGSFLQTPLPRCDAVVASLALHHIRTQKTKGELYGRMRSALRPGGIVVTVDCNPAGDAKLAAKQRSAWTDHLLKSYNKKEARSLLRAWAHEDFYVPLQAESRLMEQAGFRVEILWRRNGFAVLRGERH